MRRNFSRQFHKPHRNYSRKKKLTMAVLDQLIDIINSPDMFEVESLTKLSIRSGVPRTTLQYWKNKLRHNPDWTPIDPTNHGAHHRIFTNEEEKALADYIRINYIEQGYHFSDKSFIILANQAYNEKYIDVENPPEFNCSKHFIQNFKKRNRISSKRAHYQRRPSASKKDIDDFINEIKRLITQSKTKNIVILNADETYWHILPNNTKTWANKGSDHVVIRTYDSTKAHITAMATINIDGSKLPLFLIAKGETERCEQNQLGDISPNESHHSTNAWMTKDLFFKYLDFIRKQYPIKQKIHLIVDRSSTHKGDDVVAKAKENNIKLHYIPPGCTDILQPLDIRIFGVLKGVTSGRILKMIDNEPTEKIGMIRSVAILIDTWKSIPDSTVNDAWSLYM